MKHILLILALLSIMGCATKRWSETDPRYTNPDTSNFTVDDEIQIGVGTSK